MADVSHFANVHLLRPSYTAPNTSAGNKNNHYIYPPQSAQGTTNNNLLETEKLLENIRFEEKLAKLDLENLITNHEDNKDASFLSDDTEIRILKSSNQFTQHNNPKRQQQRTSQPSKSFANLKRSVSSNLQHNRLWKSDLSVGGASSNSTLNEIEEIKRDSRENALVDRSKSDRLMSLCQIPSLPDPNLEVASYLSASGSLQDIQSLKITNEKFLAKMKNQGKISQKEDRLENRLNTKNIHSTNTSTPIKPLSTVNVNLSVKKVSFLTNGASSDVTVTGDPVTPYQNNNNTSYATSIQDNTTSEVEPEPKSIYFDADSKTSIAQKNGLQQNRKTCASLPTQEKEQLEYEKLQLRYDQKLLEKEREKLRKEKEKFIAEKQKFREEAKELKRQKVAFEKNLSAFQQNLDGFKQEQEALLQQKRHISQNREQETSLADKASRPSSQSNASAASNKLEVPTMNELNFENVELKLTISEQNVKVSNLASELQDHKAYIKTLEDCLNSVYKQNKLYGHQNYQLRQKNGKLLYMNEFLIYTIKDVYVEYLIKALHTVSPRAYTVPKRPIMRKGAVVHHLKMDKIPTEEVSEISKIFQPKKLLKPLKSAPPSSHIHTRRPVSLMGLLAQHNLQPDLSNIFTQRCRGLSSHITTRSTESSGFSSDKAAPMTPRQKFKVVALTVLGAVRIRRAFVAAQKRDRKVYAFLSDGLV